MPKRGRSTISRVARGATCACVAALVIGAFTAVQARSALVWVDDMGFSPRTVTVTQGSVVEWVFAGASTQTVSGATGLRLFASGPQDHGGSFAFRFVAAGNYLYNDETTLSTGKVRVPIRVHPRTRPIGATFTVTWASAPPPPDYDYEVEVRWPGSAAFSDWQLHTDQTSDTYEPQLGRGDYQFRARIRRISSGKTSGWSPVRSVTVT